jgi:hypothetical protein
MLDSNAQASTRVRAADSALDHAEQAIEIEYVEIRVAALEQAAELSNQGRQIFKGRDPDKTPETFTALLSPSTNIRDRPRTQFSETQRSVSDRKE